MTGDKLAEIFEDYLKRGDGYILGLNNEIYTAERAERLKKQNAAYYARGDKWIGRRCSDCSGAIVGAMRTENPNYGDRRADTFAAQFAGGKQPIATIPDVRGVAVWKSGHIGVYVGNCLVIEFRGIDYGCVKTALHSRPWTHWGYVAGVNYDAPMQSYPRQMAVCTKKDPLNLRQSAKTGSIAAKMPKSAAVWAMRESGGWCECVYYSADNDKYYGGYASKEYLK